MVFDAVPRRSGQGPGLSNPPAKGLSEDAGLFDKGGGTDEDTIIVEG